MSDDDKKLEQRIDSWLNDWLANEKRQMDEDEEMAFDGEGQALDDEHFLQRLRERFDDLDQHPKDGVITVDEVRECLLNPPDGFDGLDMCMLRLLQDYYQVLSEFFDNEEGASDRGVSLDDLDVLENCLTSSSSRFMIKELLQANEG